ncbi:transcription factor S [Halovivax gelatinilyticus]|uniref:transcription factor S n=1 Tax=Halovivax gelatinilyticus TaxID=2961597 RepID=UPI0020CA5E39|nr:transcription factor S [Halovivax gelatinilyticus]
MEFCDECGSMMKADDGLWVCGSCEFTKAKDDAQAYVVTDAQESSEIIESSEENSLPETEVQCPNCENDTAYWYLQQIRSADESETRFFICTECEHKWREDDH